MVLLGYEGLRGQMVVYLGYDGEYGPRQAASPRHLLELINQYQLRMAKHPPAPDSGYDPMGIVTVLAPGLRAVLGRLHALAGYPLLGLVRDAGGGVTVLRLSGVSATDSEIELEPDAPVPGTLLLADAAEQPLLILDPWLIFAQCSECGTLEVAALAGQQGRETRYIGLDCGHSWAMIGPPEPPPLDLATADTAGWAPAMDAPPPPPTPGEAARAAHWDAEQQAMAAERAAHHPHVVTSEELEAQTQTLRRQIAAGGARRIAPEQAGVPAEMARNLADYQRLTALQEAAARGAEGGNDGAT